MMRHSAPLRDRRRFRRFVANRRVWVLQDGSWLPTTTQDVSQGGMAVRDVVGLRTDAASEFQVDFIEDATPLPLTGGVRHVDRGGAHVEFISGQDVAAASVRRVIETNVIPRLERAVAAGASGAPAAIDLAGWYVEIGRLGNVLAVYKEALRRGQDSIELFEHFASWLLATARRADDPAPIIGHLKQVLSDSRALGSSGVLDSIRADVLREFSRRTPPAGGHRQPQLRVVEKSSESRGPHLRVVEKPSVATHVSTLRSDTGSGDAAAAGSAASGASTNSQPVPVPKIEAVEVETPPVPVPKIEAVELQTPPVPVPKTEAVEVETPPVPVPKIEAVELQTPPVPVPKIEAVEDQTPPFPVPKIEAVEDQTQPFPVLPLQNHEVHSHPVPAPPIPELGDHESRAAAQPGSAVGRAPGDLLGEAPPAGARQPPATAQLQIRTPSAERRSTDRLEAVALARRRRLIIGVAATVAVAVAAVLTLLPSTESSDAAGTASPTAVAPAPGEAANHSTDAEQTLLDQWEPDLMERPPNGTRRANRGRHGTRRTRKERRTAASHAPAQTERLAATPAPQNGSKPQTSPAGPTRRELLAAMRDLKARKPLLAIEALESLTREHPRFADAYLALGLANAQLGRRTRALDMYERFLVLAPAHPKAERVREMLAAYGR